MHNVHLLVVRAQSPQDACDRVEDYIMDWGDENNWKTICGCVSEDDKVYINDKSGRYPPDKNSNTIKKINKLINNWINKPNTYCDAAIERLKEEPDFTKWNDTIDLLYLKDYVEYLSNKVRCGKGRVDVFNTSFYSGEYDEVGVTQVEVEDDEVSDDDKRYVVFIDTHS